MTRFKTNYNIDPKKEKGEKSDGIIVTIPDQSLSVAEIITRFVQGRGSSVTQLPGTFDDMPDVSKMTLEELDLAKREIEENIYDLEDDLNKLVTEHKNKVALKKQQKAQNELDTKTKKANKSETDE